jgi:hypothetical protein
MKRPFRPWEAHLQPPPKPGVVAAKLQAERKADAARKREVYAARLAAHQCTKCGVALDAADPATRCALHLSRTHGRRRGKFG